MITGFNHNIKHKDRIFHIQTEDSGTKNPHIITHLFVGGNIVATVKTDYRHLLSIQEPAMFQTAVKNMMEEQHKQMLRNLIHGKFDNAANVENAHHLDGPAPLNVDANVLASTGGSGNKGPTSNPRNNTLPPPMGAGKPTPIMPTVVPPAARPTPAVAIPALPIRKVPSEAPAPMDLAAAAAHILRQHATPPLAAPAPVPAKPAPVDIPAEANLPPEVLAARALKEKPVEKPAGDTIFGEDLISEKSLDEVILSYLSIEPD